MASPTQWTWVWASSGSWQWTGKPGVLQSMGSQRVGHNWAAKLNWTFKKWCTVKFTFFWLYSSVEFENYMEMCNSLQSRCRAAPWPLPQVPRCSHLYSILSPAPALDVVPVFSSSRYCTWILLYTVFGVLSLASFTYHNAFEFIHVAIYQ